VERAIQYVRHSFFGARPFTTLEHFNANSEVFASRSPDRGRRAKSWGESLPGSCAAQNSAPGYFCTSAGNKSGALKGRG
jgi:hypothetical protein